jgi:hypothetical protein
MITHTRKQVHTYTHTQKSHNHTSLQSGPQISPMIHLPTPSILPPQQPTTSSPCHPHTSPAAPAPSPPLTVQHTHSPTAAAHPQPPSPPPSPGKSSQQGSSSRQGHHGLHFDPLDNNNAQEQQLEQHDQVQRKSGGGVASRGPSFTSTFREIRRGMAFPGNLFGSPRARAGASKHTPRVEKSAASKHRAAAAAAQGGEDSPLSRSKGGPAQQQGAPASSRAHLSGARAAARAAAASGFLRTSQTASGSASQACGDGDKEFEAES